MGKKTFPQFYIDGIYLHNISFSINPEFNVSSESSLPDFGLSVEASHNKVSEKKLILKISVDIVFEEVKEKDAPLNLHICMIGKFSTLEDVSSEDIEQFIRVNGPAIMFPYFREMISSVTARSVFPTLMIPPLNMYDFIMTEKK